MHDATLEIHEHAHAPLSVLGDAQKDPTPRDQDLIISKHHMARELTSMKKINAILPSTSSSSLLLL